MDQIGEVLKSHLDLAERQLELAENGVEISLQGNEGTEFVAVPVEELRKRVAGLRRALEQHEARHA
jgi:hypothetical protein